MEVLTNFLTALTTVFTTYVPGLAKAIYEMFINIFANTTVTEGVTTVTGLNELGYLAVGIIGIGIVSGLVSLAMHVLRLRGRASRNRRAV